MSLKRPSARQIARFVLFLLLAHCLVLPGAGLITSAAASGQGRNVLIIYANGRLLPANVEVDRGLRQSVSSVAGREVNVFDEFLDAPHFSGPDFAQTFATFLRTKYASRPPDVIVAAGTEALQFLLAQRELLFPRAAIAHLGIPRDILLTFPPLPAGVHGVPIEFVSAATLEGALRWHSGVERLVVVTGAASWDRQWEARLRGEAERFAERVEVEFLSGLPLGQVIERLERLDPRTVIFTPGFFVDGAGERLTPRESVVAMAGAAKAPIYGPFNTFIGTGVVGGYMPNFEAVGQQGGLVVSALLAGREVASLDLPAVSPARLNLDWRAVRRWDIDESLLPGDTVLHFKRDSFLETYRYEVAAICLVLLLQGGFIAWLVIERRQRRQVERTLQQQRFDLSHASRRAVAGELTESIAHEINQPLAAILSNAEAAELILESGQERRDEIRAILADIRRDDLRANEVIRRLRGFLAKQASERQLVDMNQVAREVRIFLGSESRRRGIGIELRLSANPANILVDRIQMQQVLINLVLNAMDAMAGQAAESRAVVIAVGDADGRVVVEVIDSGAGIPAEDRPRIFESFFSTKANGMGLGLSIARSLVEAHGGTIRALPDAGGGACLQVEFPAAGQGGL